MQRMVLAAHKPASVSPTDRLRFAAQFRDLRERIARLEEEKRILLRELRRTESPSMRPDLSLAYAEAKLPGYSYEYD